MFRLVCEKIVYNVLIAQYMVLWYTLVASCECMAMCKASGATPTFLWPYKNWAWSFMVFQYTESPRLTRILGLEKNSVSGTVGGVPY